jgi:hypothetical protein
MGVFAFRSSVTHPVTSDRPGRSGTHPAVRFVDKLMAFLFHSPSAAAGLVILICSGRRSGLPPRSRREKSEWLLFRNISFGIGFRPSRQRMKSSSTRSRLTRRQRRSSKTRPTDNQTLSSGSLDSHFRKESEFEAFERVVVEAHLRQPGQWNGRRTGRLASTLRGP